MRLKCGLVKFKNLGLSLSKYSRREDMQGNQFKAGAINCIYENKNLFPNTNEWQIFFF